jgi:transcription elongation factor Elf1
LRCSEAEAQNKRKASSQAALRRPRKAQGCVMDIRRLSASSPLSIECPHCKHAEDDDFEVVEQDALHVMRCVACEGDFHFAVMECRMCGAEDLFIWAHRPATDAVDAMACPACGWNYVEDEAPSAKAGFAV